MRSSPKAPLSVVSHSFRLILGRALISRSGPEAWVFFFLNVRAWNTHVESPFSCPGRRALEDLANLVNENPALMVAAELRPYVDMLRTLLKERATSDEADRLRALDAMDGDSDDDDGGDWIRSDQFLAKRASAVGLTAPLMQRHFKWCRFERKKHGPERRSLVEKIQREPTERGGVS